MPDKRVGSSASVINGKIYVIGGWDYSGSNAIYYGDVWEYDPITDTWDDTTKMDMPIPRAYLRTCVFDGKSYAFGGRNANSALRRVEAYDPVTNTWSTKADMPAGRIYLMASSLDSLIYIFGGSTGPFDPPMSNAWEYNPAGDSFKVVSPMPTGLITANCNEVSKKIYIIGGSRTPWVFQPDYLVLEYNPHNDSLSSLTAIEKGDKNLPNVFSLNQNYPNPFNPEPTIQYQLAKRSEVKLTIVNPLGQRVAILVDEAQSIGTYSVKWDGKDDTGIELASGIYLFRLQTREFVQVKKLVLLR